MNDKGATKWPSTADALLSTDDLQAGYGPVRALFGVSLSIPAGTVLAVLGPNGAGKSTLARTVSGFVPPTAGKVFFAGREITGWTAHRIRRAGLTHIPEGRGIFPGLSVTDNLKVAVRQADKPARGGAIQRAFDLFPVLGERQQQRASSLSGGEQQMLALARALALAPRLIIADEMSLGLAPKMVDLVFDSLDSARREGVTIVLVEQFVHRAIGFADQCLILHKGRPAWSGPAAEAREDILERYLGAAAEGAA
jgi:branched-chain amino acid transport system ATP-binding protein